MNNMINNITLNDIILNDMIADQYGKEAGRKVEFDKTQTPIIWASTMMDIFTLIKKLKSDPLLHIDALTDLTAYDNVDGIDGAKRFVLVYQLFSHTLFIRVRLKVLIDEKEGAITVTPHFPPANWMEREVFDMYGIVFKGHPDLRRILMDERFIGHPLRKEYDIHTRMPFADSIKINMDRHPIPMDSEGEAKKENLKNVKNIKNERVNLADFYNPNILVNIGPSHPAMHGTLRVMCRLNGEIIEDVKCDLGLLHRAMEKLGETKTYHQWIVYTDRLNYCSALNNNVAYTMAVESLLGITITERCMWIRMVCMELSRVIDHIICVAINALDMGAMTVFWLLYNWREEAYTMIESMCGMRLTTSYTRIGGLMYDIPDDLVARLEKFCEEFPRALDEVSGLLTTNRIWIDRTRGVGTLTAEKAKQLSATGPILRASGVDLDLRRDRPYYAYSDLDFDVVVASNGDVYDRYLVRMEEMRQSIRLLKQCIKPLNDTKGGPIWVEDRRVRIPEKSDVYTKMEVLIHHFQIFMEGIKVPSGESYTAVEGPNGELGFYIVSRGGPKAWRMRIKSPSFMHYQLLENTLRGEQIPDAISILGSLNIIAGELDR